MAEVLRRHARLARGMQEEVNSERGGGTGRLITDIHTYMTAKDNELEESTTETTKM